MSSMSSELVVETFPLTFGGYTYAHSRIVYVRGRPPAPVVLVYPNYAGLKQFDVDQAAFLAKAGYVGLAADLYEDLPEYSYADRDPPAPWRYQAALDGEGRSALRRHQRGSDAAMDALLRDPARWRALLAAYLAAAREHPAVRPGSAGAVGYCFGAQCLLEQVRAGHDLQAVVSFHGLLHSRPRHRTEDRRLTPQEYEREVELAPNSYNARCQVLIEHGDLDSRPGRDPQSIAAWKAEMDANGVRWRFHSHARARHGFALAPAVYSSEYSESADRRSTLAMLSLFAEVWPADPQYPVEVNACGTRLGQCVLTSRRARL